MTPDVRASSGCLGRANATTHRERPEQVAGFRFGMPTGTEACDHFVHFCPRSIAAMHLPRKQESRIRLPARAPFRPVPSVAGDALCTAATGVRFLHRAPDIIAPIVQAAVHCLGTTETVVQLNLGAPN